MLEHHIRKLIREEASAAAIDGVAAMKSELAAAIREIGKTEFTRATSAIETYVRSHVAPPNRLRSTSRSMAMIDGSTDSIVRARLRCLELALQAPGPDESRLSLAASYAEFVIDGFLASDAIVPA